MTGRDTLHSQSTQSGKPGETPDSERIVLDPVDASQGHRRPNMVIVLGASLALALIVASALSWYFSF